uniref:L-type lectin-like domain-containing protein n=2 Tax=Eptatretus burgeri TaxID=7764 RepID=A0A8C4QPN6_EPTBU
MVTCGLLRTLLCLWISFETEAQTEVPSRRLEPAFSLGAARHEHASSSLSHWRPQGNAVVSKNKIRLASALQDQRGAIWAADPLTFPNWQAEASLQITGRGRVGADGLAFWFTERPGGQGPVYGVEDRWNGLGVFFDSFDNDRKNKNPIVLIVGNDGSMEYDHQNDGMNQTLDSCYRDFRNRLYPINVNVVYYKSTLEVMVSMGNSPQPDDVQLCARVENMILPKQGYFGFSAATGDIADDHDILSFIVHSLYEPGQQPLEHEVTEPENDAQGAPDDQRAMPEVELASADLKHIFEGQSKIQAEIKNLGRRIDLLVEEQRKQVDIAAQVLGQTTGDVKADGGLRLQEMMKYQQQLINNVDEVKTMMTQLSQDVHAGRPESGNPYEAMQHLTQMRDHLEGVRRDVGNLNQRQHEQPMRCPEHPPLPSCLNTSLFLGFVVLQTLILFGYFAYRSHKE